MCIVSNWVNEAQDLMAVTKYDDLLNSLIPNKEFGGPQNVQKMGKNHASSCIAISYFCVCYLSSALGRCYSMVLWIDGVRMINYHFCHLQPEILHKSIFQSTCETFDG